MPKLAVRSLWNGQSPVDFRPCAVSLTPYCRATCAHVRRRLISSTLNRGRAWPAAAVSAGISCPCAQGFTGNGISFYGFALGRLAPAILPHIAGAAGLAVALRAVLARALASRARPALAGHHLGHLAA